MIDDIKLTAPIIDLEEGFVHEPDRAGQDDHGRRGAHRRTDHRLR
jgi:hypothetical protein